MFDSLPGSNLCLTKYLEIMCNISKKTKLKKVTVFTAVIKHKEDYYSYFSLKKLKVGKVIPLTMEELNKCPVSTGSAKDYLNPNEQFYNENMVGRVSGFATIDPANTLYDTFGKVVLKVVLGGDIMRGTAKNVMERRYNKRVVYAGTEIISMEEV